ncbi:hypothetical protein [Yersinia pseudotuberculosis]|uniref:hypothetical protein n=1 Tax=Yersinia pseudotuberculosis TaxID=633 RepID=UPI000B01CCC8|nr:hypothetical protein [Yersinia pseudotuberculosis]
MLLILAFVFPSSTQTWTKAGCAPLLLVRMLTSFSAAGNITRVPLIVIAANAGMLLIISDNTKIIIFENITLPNNNALNQQTYLYNRLATAAFYPPRQQAVMLYCCGDPHKVDHTPITQIGN